MLFLVAFVVLWAHCCSPGYYGSSCKYHLVPETVMFIRRLEGAAVAGQIEVDPLLVAGGGQEIVVTSTNIFPVEYTSFYDTVIMRYNPFTSKVYFLAHYRSHASTTFLVGDSLSIDIGVVIDAVEGTATGTSYVEVVPNVGMNVTQPSVYATQTPKLIPVNETTPPPTLSIEAVVVDNFPIFSRPSYGFQVLEAPAFSYGKLKTLMTLHDPASPTFTIPAHLLSSGNYSIRVNITTFFHQKAETIWTKTLDTNWDNQAQTRRSSLPVASSEYERRTSYPSCATPAQTIGGCAFAQSVNYVFHTSKDSVQVSFGPTSADYRLTSVWTGFSWPHYREVLPAVVGTTYTVKGLDLALGTYTVYGQSCWGHHWWNVWEVNFLAHSCTGLIIVRSPDLKCSITVTSPMGVVATHVAKFTASCSIGSSNLAYQWDVYNQATHSTVTSSFVGGSSSQAMSFTPPTQGTHRVGVTVTDLNTGLKKWYSATQNVLANAAPSVSVSVTTSVVQIKGGGAQVTAHATMRVYGSVSNPSSSTPYVHSVPGIFDVAWKVDGVVQTGKTTDKLTVVVKTWVPSMVIEVFGTELFTGFNPTGKASKTVTFQKSMMGTCSGKMLGAGGVAGACSVSCSNFQVPPGSTYELQLVGILGPTTFGTFTDPTSMVATPAIRSGTVNVVVTPPGGISFTRYVMNKPYGVPVPPPLLPIPTITFPTTPLFSGTFSFSFLGPIIPAPGCCTPSPYIPPGPTWPPPGWPFRREAELTETSIDGHNYALHHAHLDTMVTNFIQNFVDLTRSELVGQMSSIMSHIYYDHPEFEEFMDLVFTAISELKESEEELSQGNVYVGASGRVYAHPQSSTIEKTMLMDVYKHFAETMFEKNSWNTFANAEEEARYDELHADGIVSLSGAFAVPDTDRFNHNHHCEPWMDLCPIPEVHHYVTGLHASTILLHATRRHSTLVVSIDPKDHIHKSVVEHLVEHIAVQMFHHVFHLNVDGSGTEGVRSLIVHPHLSASWESVQHDYVKYKLPDHGVSGRVVVTGTGLVNTHHWDELAASDATKALLAGKSAAPGYYVRAFHQEVAGDTEEFEIKVNRTALVGKDGFVCAFSNDVTHVTVGQSISATHPCELSSDDIHITCRCVGRSKGFVTVLSNAVFSDVSEILPADAGGMTGGEVTGLVLSLLFALVIVILVVAIGMMTYYMVKTGKGPREGLASATQDTELRPVGPKATLKSVGDGKKLKMSNPNCWVRKNSDNTIDFGSLEGMKTFNFDDLTDILEVGETEMEKEFAVVFVDRGLKVDMVVQLPNERCDEFLDLLGFVLG